MLRACLSVFVLAACLSASGLAQGSAPGTDPKAVKPSAPVNLNTAAAAELAGLPGVGEKTAARIIEYRQKSGPFRKIEELMNVQGIGEKSFLKLKPLLTVGSRPEPAAAPKQE
jgi:competence protein ComEA